MKRVGALKTQTGTFVPSSPLTGRDGLAMASMVTDMPALRYPYPLSLYTDPPLCEVTVEEFEELAFARLESNRS